MRMWSLCLIALILAVQYRIWVSDDGMVAVRHLEQQVDALHQGNERMIRRNARLKAEVLDLKHGTGVIEARARRELGMIGENEVLYQFADP